VAGSSSPEGQLVILEHTSKVLSDNPLDDPHVRKLPVWLPPQYSAAPNRRRDLLRSEKWGPQSPCFLTASLRSA
jgi:hypothetical protein